MPNAIELLSPKAYYRANVGLYQTTDTSTPATANGHPVGRWEDQSGNGYHLTQATSGLRPTLVTNRFKTLPAINFDDASTQWLTNASFPWTQSKTSGVWVVACQLDVGVPSSGLVTTTQDQLGLLVADGSMYAYLNGAAAEYSTGSLLTKQGFVAVLSYNGAGSGNSGRMKLYRNLNQIPLNFTGTISATTYSGGSTLYMGRQAAGGYLRGRIVEAAFFASLADADRIAVTNYLGTTYFSRATKDLIIHGDSRTAGFPNATNNTPPLTGLDSYPLHARVSLSVSDWTLRNAGAAGLQWPTIVAGSNQLIDAYQDDWSAGQVVVCFAGTNDFVAGRTVAQCLTSINTFVSDRHNAGFSHVYVGTQPQDTQPTSVTNCDSLNVSIRANAFGADRIVDFGADPAFDTVSDCANTTNYEGDGVHMTDAGNAKLANVLVNSVLMDFAPPVPSVIYWYDTLDGTTDADLKGRSGQVGASYIRHPGGGSDWADGVNNNWFHLTGNGRAYGGVYGYKYALYMASGVPADAEYDVRTTFDALSDPGGDNVTGIVFKMNASTVDFWTVGYQGFNKQWVLQKYTSGVPSTQGTWGDVQTAWPTSRNVEVRIRSTSPYIRVWIDGLERITSADSTSPGSRFGLFQTGGNPGTTTTGLQFAQVAAGSVGFTLPVYQVVGPSGGPPGGASAAYTASLTAGMNPGSITITPSATGVAGTFTPATVTLTDASRSATFTFTPSGTGTATISFANNGGVGNAGDMTYVSAFLPPDRLDYFKTTFTKFTTAGSQPYIAFTTTARGTGGYAMDIFDHYDPPHCFRRAKRWADRNGVTMPSVAPEIQAGMVRIRDRAINAMGRPGWAPNGRSGDWDDREGKGVLWYHRKLDGIAEHYIETGDPRCIESADILAGDGAIPASFFSLTDNNVGVMREAAFALQAMLARYRMGLGANPLIDDAARLLLWMVDLIAVPYADKKYGITLKTFMGGLLSRALITYWEMFLDDPARSVIIGQIPGRLKAFSDYMANTGGVGGQPAVWWPAGTDWGDGWLHGSVTYRDLPNDDPKFVPIAGNAFTSIPQPRSVFRGPASLSTVDNYYQFSTFVVEAIADAFTIASYTGATREITLGSYRPGRDITMADTFKIMPAAWTDPSQNENAGPVPELNGMVAPLDAWCYWHEKVVLGNAAGSYVYRQRFHDKFNGNYQSWNQAYAQKAWNQSLIWLTDGLDWAARADGPEWTAASGLTLQAPMIGSKVFAGRRSGTFRISVPYGQRLDAPETVIPARTGTGTLSAPAPILTTTEPRGGFTITPAVGEIGTAPVVSAIGDDLDPDASYPLTVAAALPARPAACTFYVASGPKQSAAGVEGEKILITLGHGTVSGTVRITPAATGGGGTFNPAFVDLDQEARSKWTKFTPTGSGARTITFTNNGGLANADPLPYQTAPYVYAAAPGYTLTGPATGDVYTDATFTVTLGTGDLPYVAADPVDNNPEANPATYRFVPYASADFEGLGEFWPEYMDLTDQRRSATFKYMPYSPGARTIGFFGPADLAEQPWSAFEATSNAPPPTPVVNYTLTGPTGGEVNALSSGFTITLGSGTLTGTVRFTPAASAGTGIFIPTTVDLTDSTRVGSFVFIPTSIGGRGITTPNNGGLANASPGITYTAITSSLPPAPVDDSPRPGTHSQFIVGGGGLKIIIPG